MHNQSDYMDVFFGDDEKAKKIARGENVSIENDADIEQVLLLLKHFEDDIEFLKNLKKKRVELIDQKMSSMSESRQNLRQFLINFLSQSKKKTYDVPDLAKIRYRAPSKGSWEVLDQEKLLEHLNELGVKEDCTEIKIKKSQLNPILDNLEKANNLTDAVQRNEATPNITISYHTDSADLYAQEKNISSSENSNEEAQNAQADRSDFDSIEI